MSNKAKSFFGDLNEKHKNKFCVLNLQNAITIEEEENNTSESSKTDKS